MAISKAFASFITSKNACEWAMLESFYEDVHGVTHAVINLEEGQYRILIDGHWIVLPLPQWAIEYQRDNAQKYKDGQEMDEHYWAATDVFELLRRGTLSCPDGAGEPVILRMGWIDFDQPWFTFEDEGGEGKITFDEVIKCIGQYGPMSWSCHIRGMAIAI